MRRVPLLFVVLCMLQTLGCSSDNLSDLAQWVEQERGRAIPKMQAMETPMAYIPQAYRVQQGTDLFSVSRLNVNAGRDGQSNSSEKLVAPELKRKKEPLEAEPIENMAMVGSLMKEGHAVALMRVNNAIHHVMVGNYLGQNFGRITKITETSVTLREIVQDGTGVWSVQEAVLQLKGGTP